MKKITVGQFLKQRRLKKGYTLNHAHMVAGLSYSTLAQWEGDDVRDMSLPKIQKLLAEYNTDIKDLITHTNSSVDCGRILQVK